MGSSHGVYMKKPNVRNILVPVDFSPMSILAVEAAKTFARRFDAQIHLLHVQEVSYPAGFMAPTPHLVGELIVIQHDNEKRLCKRLRDWGARLDLLPEQCHVISGSPVFDAICQMAHRLSIDLIVMPTHGRTGLNRVFFGSTTERVVQHSPCPVFIARKRTGETNTILVPVDFSGCSLDALKYAIQLAKVLAARIIVCHVVHLGYAFTSDGYAMYDMSEIIKALRKEAEKQMIEFVRAAKFDGVKFETVVQTGAAVDEICALAQGKDVDLIITPTHGRTGLKHILIGSVAEQIVRRADRPVLVLPSHPAMRAHAVKKRPVACRLAARGIRKSRPNGNKLSARLRLTNRPASPFPERRKTNKFREPHTNV